MLTDLRALFDDAETLQYWKDVKNKEAGEKKEQDKKKAQIEASRTAYKESQTQEMDPYETIKRLKLDNARRYNQLKDASIVMQKETVTLVRDESRKFIKDTTNFVVKIVQKEMLLLL